MKYSNLIRTLSYRERLILLENKFTALEKEKAESVFSNISLAESVETAVQTEDEISENFVEESTKEENNLPAKELPLVRYFILCSLLAIYYL
jgi:hypothetical protein